MYRLCHGTRCHLVDKFVHAPKKLNTCSDLYEFGTGIGGLIIGPITYCSWVNLLLLLIVIAVNRYFAVTQPVLVCSRKQELNPLFLQYISRGLRLKTH